MADSANTASSDQATGGGKSGHNRLTLYIVIAILAAIVASLIAPKLAMSFEIGGQIFLRLLQMIVVTVVACDLLGRVNHLLQVSICAFCE